MLPDVVWAGHVVPARAKVALGCGPAEPSLVVPRFPVALPSSEVADVWSAPPVMQWVRPRRTRGRAGDPSTQIGTRLEVVRRFELSIGALKEGCRPLARQLRCAQPFTRCAPYR